MARWLVFCLGHRTDKQSPSIHNATREVNLRSGELEDIVVLTDVAPVPCQPSVGCVLVQLPCVAFRPTYLLLRIAVLLADAEEVLLPVRDAEEELLPDLDAEEELLPDSDAEVVLLPVRDALPLAVVLLL